jgi:geranylgeranyl pyrophosphate synthase
MAVTEKDFTKQFESKVRLVNKELGRILSKRGLMSGELKEPMRYALEGPGKRVRPTVVLWCCELIRGRVNHNALIAAAAIEMVHTYSLIHDDLPAMDNDDYRRGRLTCHRKFDEATAILTGDGLLTLAFEILAKEIDEPKTSVRLIAELCEAAGPGGMVAGQLADLKAARPSSPQAENEEVNEKALKQIHTNKTAKMFRCAAAMGGICGGASEQQVRRLKEYGLKIGLGFQIADDILDVLASSEQLGKTSGKDVEQGKATYPAIVGLEESRRMAERLAGEAIEVLKPFDKAQGGPFGKKADMLCRLATILLNRTR